MKIFIVAYSIAVKSNAVVGMLRKNGHILYKTLSFAYVGHWHDKSRVPPHLEINE